MAINYEDILYEKDEPVAVLTLNRPQSLNAYTSRMVNEMVSAIDNAATDNRISVLIITGAGRAFCSGVDNRDPQPKLSGVPGIVRYKWRLYPVIERLFVFDKPVICALNGIAAGAGTSLSMICDIRIASDQARFSMVWAKRGMVPDNGASYFLVRLIGPAKAYELTLSGDVIDAEEMRSIGLVSKVVPHEALMKEAKNIAYRLSEGSLTAMQLSKRLIRSAIKEQRISLQLEMEEYYQSITE